jgi:hypothetical protein
MTIKTKPTPKQVALIILFLTILYTHYRITHQLEWEIDLEWTTWESNVQNSIRELIPEPFNHSTGTLSFSHLDNLKLFPNLVVSNISEFVVPMPDYDEMGRVRGELASLLKNVALCSCEMLQNQVSKEQTTGHVLPVMGITVANDTPQNQYLRRILHTIDFEAVGSIVITWYDEHTEAQLLNNQPGLSHIVVEEALVEYIERFGFVEMNWKTADTNYATFNLQLASVKSLQLLSDITTSIHQYCRFDSEFITQQSHSMCQNELLIVRFPTNLGCSTGVNNPLFTHPTSPYWLIANYDIAYPPSVLKNMGLSVQNTIQTLPELAVHTFGYIYGRGKLENPWSNFVMTSCAVAKVGVWDEDIFPAYYEDDDFRDRIRYVMGRWEDRFYGSEQKGYEDAPSKWMEDRHLIRYQTDRSVAVAHGPLSAGTYISGTHATMEKVQDEEEKANEKSVLHWLFRRSSAATLPQNPFHYDSLRWKTVRELADAESFFRCKHGNLPDPGEFGQDTLRYFAWNERYLLPFIRETRVDRMRKSYYDANVTSTVNEVDLSQWSRWSFNATRRQCVHEGANKLLSLPYSEDENVLEQRKNLTSELRELCSVCHPLSHLLATWTERLVSLLKKEEEFVLEEMANLTMLL